jgi:uncharacterized DUF497 family protein
LFEYHPAKSASNKVKHGVDFEEAQALWDDEDILYTASAYIGEDRLLAIGQMNGKFYTAAITLRGRAIRIISVRRSRRDEVRDYERAAEGDQR